MKTNTQTNTAPLSKDQALKKYDKATRLRWRSPIPEWRAAFPTLESLAEFRRDVGNLSWPGSYGQSPWDDAFSLAYNLGAGISESSRRYILDNANCDWGRQMLAVYAEYGLKIEASPAPVVAPVAEPSPLVPLSAPVGVSGVTLPAVETSKATLTFASYETAKEFRTAWTRFSKRGTSLSPRNANGGATLDLWGVTEQEKPWIEAKIAELGGNSPAPSTAEPVTPPASPVDSVGVPEPAYRVIESFTKRCTDPIDHDGELYGVIQGPEFALDVFSPAAMTMDAFKETLSAFAGNAASHAANLAKIQALEAALDGLLDAVHADALSFPSSPNAVSKARAALALPSA